jgi:hypothetical protein
VEIARRIGSGPIITGGIDFSFTLDNYHARSTPAHLADIAAQNRFRSLLNPGAAFRQGVSQTLSKTGIPVLSDPVMRNYRNLFEEVFSRDRRIFDTGSSGLPLGLKILSLEEVLSILLGGTKTSLPRSIVGPGTYTIPDAQSVRVFIEQERKSLLQLKLILCGEENAGIEVLERLLDHCGYLWAHFPECAGAGGRRPSGADLSFLKRVRAETDSFLKLWDLAYKEI